MDSELEAAKLEYVRDLERQLRAAQLASDVDALDELIADDLVFVGMAGNLATKAMDLATHREGVLKLKSSELRDEQIRVLGEGAAVAVVLLHLEGSYGGEEFAGEFRYTRVWQRLDEGWRIVAGHMGALPS